MTEVNFAQLMESAGAGFSPVPHGTYNAVISKSEAGASKTGKAMINVQFKIMGGPHDGRIVFNNFTISPESQGALKYFFQHMNALGLPGDYFAQNPPTAAVAEALLGRQATIDVAIENYQGVDRNAVKNIKPLQGGGAPAMPQGAVPVAPAAPVAPATPPVAPPAPVAPVAPPVAPPAPPAPVAPPAAPVPVPAPPVAPPPPPPAPSF